MDHLMTEWQNDRISGKKIKAAKGGKPHQKILKQKQRNTRLVKIANYRKLICCRILFCQYNMNTISGCQN